MKKSLIIILTLFSFNSCGAFDLYDTAVNRYAKISEYYAGLNHLSILGGTLCVIGAAAAYQGNKDWAISILGGVGVVTSFMCVNENNLNKNTGILNLGILTTGIGTALYTNNALLAFSTLAFGSIIFDLNHQLANLDLNLLTDQDLLANQEPSSSKKLYALCMTGLVGMGMGDLLSENNDALAIPNYLGSHFLDYWNNKNQ